MLDMRLFQVQMQEQGDQEDRENQTVKPKKPLSLWEGPDSSW